MDKVLPLLHTVPIVVIATNYMKVNFTTIGDVAIAGLNPPLLMISLHEKHYARHAIDKEEVFSVNIPSEDMIKELNTCGMYSGYEYDKSKIFKTQFKNQIPYITSCPINLFCKKVKKVQVEHRVIYVALVEETLIKQDLSSIKSVMYGLDNNYYAVGPTIAKGYEDYIKLEKSE